MKELLDRPKRQVRDWAISIYTLPEELIVRDTSNLKLAIGDAFLHTKFSHIWSSPCLAGVVFLLARYVRSLGALNS